MTHCEANGTYLDGTLQADRLVYPAPKIPNRSSSSKNRSEFKVGLVRVVMIPSRVVEMVPVRVVPLDVVEIVPDLVVEMVPTLVVEMVPGFANVVAEIAKTNIPDHAIALKFFMICSYN